MLRPDSEMMHVLMIEIGMLQRVARRDHPASLTGLKAETRLIYQRPAEEAQEAAGSCSSTMASGCGDRGLLPSRVVASVGGRGRGRGDRRGEEGGGGKLSLVLILALICYDVSPQL